MSARPEWMESASCRQTDAEVFYPEGGKSANPARAICARCDVRERCLEWAIDHHETDGVWGGMTPIERRVHAGSTPGIENVAYTTEAYTVQEIADLTGLALEGAKTRIGDLKPAIVGKRGRRTLYQGSPELLKRTRTVQR